MDDEPVDRTGIPAVVVPDAVDGAHPESTPRASEPGQLPGGPPHSTEQRMRVLVFTVAARDYVVDIAQTREVVRGATVAAMPGVAPFVQGVIKRRGRIVPVVNLRRRLGLPLLPSPQETCIVVVRLPSGPVGFLVDGVLELVWVWPGDFEAPSPLLARPDQEYVRGVAYLGDRVLTMLDLTRALAPAEQDDLTRSLVGAAEPGEFQANHIPDADEDAATGEREGGERQRRVRLLAFEMAGALYAVALARVSEVRELGPLMPLPHLPPYVLGLVNLRGAVVPVIALDEVVAVAEPSGLPPALQGAGQRLIVLKGSGYQVALRVPSMHGLIEAPVVAYHAALPGAGLLEECILGFAVVEDRLVTCLDAAALIARTALLDHAGAAL